MTLYIDTKPTLDEWVAHDHLPNYPIWYNYTMFGRYIISRTSVNFALFLVGHVYDDNEKVSDDLGEFNTLSEAKAAAQADYERRTAERFVPVEIPDSASPHIKHLWQHYCAGWNDAIDMLTQATKEAKP